MAKELTRALIDIKEGRTPVLSPEVKKALTLAAVFASEMAKKVSQEFDIIINENNIYCKLILNY